jgi:hypothetical protein
MVFNATLNNISVISWQFSIGSNVKVALCWLLFWISDQHKKNFCKGPYHPMISQILSHGPTGHFHFDGSSGHFGINGYQVYCL